MSCEAGPPGVVLETQAARFSELYHMIIMFAGLDNIFMTAYSACTASIMNSNKLIICRNDLPIPLVVAMDPAQTKIDGCEAFNQPAWN